MNKKGDTLITIFEGVSLRVKIQKKLNTLKDVCIQLIEGNPILFYINKKDRKEPIYFNGKYLGYDAMFALSSTYELMLYDKLTVRNNNIIWPIYHYSKYWTILSNSGFNSLSLLRQLFYNNGSSFFMSVIQIIERRDAIIDHDNDRISKISSSDWIKV